MSTNLISSIMQFISPDMIVKIASALGLERSIAQKAISVGVPAILAGLASVASKPGGVQQLSGVLAQQKPGVLDSLVSAIGGSAQTERVEEGSDLLSGLLGGGGLNALTSALSTYTGTSPGKSETLLGLLGPMVMGALGQQQRKTGLGGSGIADLLVSQKDQIVSALPASFTEHLSSSGFLNTLDKGTRDSMESASIAARRVAGMGNDTVAAASRAASATAQSASTWPYWLAGLAVLFGLGWYFLGDREPTRTAEQTARPAAPPSETVGRGTPNQMAADISGQLTSSVGNVRSTLQDITDLASAQAAMPKLQQMTAQLDKINTAAAQLPPEARKVIASQLAGAMPGFNQLCERVLAIPGVASIAKPLIDSMRTKLDTMARA